MPLPFYGEEFVFTQPDGSQIKLTGWGNQNYAVFESLDGYTVVKDPLTGFYQYAKLSADRHYLEPTGVRVGLADPETLQLTKHLRAPRNVAREMARAAFRPTESKSRWQVRRDKVRSARRMAMMAPGILPAPPSEERKGEYVGLCILVQFPDVPGSISQTEVDHFCNKKGYDGFGNKGSVYDYFYDVSRGKLEYTNIVTPYCVAKNPKDYYTNRNIRQPERAVELIEEALSELKAGGFDFSQLSVDDEGYVYALNVFYAGPRTNNWAEGLWPHSWHLDTPFDIGSGRKFYDYQITDMGHELSLATFCHENGHLVCDFPDLYDYGFDDPLGQAESNGVGVYCLMCAGGSNRKNPAQVCGYLKYKAGWADQVTPITEGLYAANADRNEFFVRAKSRTEYFLVETRYKEGRDISLPASGLAIWHVDELGSNDYEDMEPHKHYECSLEQADNLFQLEKGVNIGDAGDLFGAPHKTTFGDSTAPSSRWWDGTSSSLEIVDISPPDRQMSFRSKGGNRFSKTSAPGKAIPDNDQGGVRDFIAFDDEAIIGSLKVSVDITHSWRGDLRLTLISPSATLAVLLNRNGGGTPDVKTVFDISSAPDLRNLVNQPLKGEWTLWVQDSAAADEGVLNSWGLEVESKQGGPGDVVELEELSAAKIPDNDPAGIMRVVNADAPGQVKHVEVSVDMTHTYIGDLVVSLISPRGTSTDLHRRFGGSQDNLIKTYSASTTPDLNRLAGEPIRGEWRLKIVDEAAEDVGKLNRWSLRIIPS